MIETSRLRFGDCHTPFRIAAIQGFALDATNGYVYVAPGTGANIMRFSLTGTGQTAVSKGSLSTVSYSGLGVDPATGKVGPGERTGFPI